jgi:hypothetical protein
VVVNGPSSWEVVAATMTPTGTLVVVIKRLPDFVAFLTSPDDAHASAPAAAAAAASPPATSSASSAPSAAAAACSSLAPLTSSDVAALVCSRGAAYTAYAAQFEKDGIDGTVLQNATMDELCDVMTAMNVTAVHKIALKAALQQWKQQPDAAVAMVAQQRQLMQAAADAGGCRSGTAEEDPGRRRAQGCCCQRASCCNQFAFASYLCPLSFRMMMIMVITTTTIMMKMIMKNKIEENSVQRRQTCKRGEGGDNEVQQFHFAQARMMCCVPPLNKPRLVIMAIITMITMTMKMITKTAIEDNNAQRRQPCCGGGGGDNDGCSLLLL